MFVAPAAANEFVGEPVEESRVRGALTLRVEITRRRHDASTEEVVPEAIHHDPCRERVLGIHEPIRQRTPATGGFEAEWTLEANPAELKGKVVQLPRREDVPHPINEQLIVELCSR